MSGASKARRAIKEAARAAGAAVFYTAEPCQRGHLSGWYVRNGACKECERLRQKAKRRRNPESVRRREARFREKHREKLNQKARARGVRQAEISRRWAKENPERNKEKAREWRARNPERVLEQGRRGQHVRRARLRCAPGALSPQIGDKLLVLQKNKCACCKASLARRKYHLDHVIALAAGGTNTDDNIQVLCAPCNLSKSTAHPVDFMQSRGFLL